MKRIVIGLFLIVIFSSAAMANVFIDGYGAFVGTNDARYQYGGGGAAGFTLTGNFNILYRGMYTIYAKDSEFEIVNNTGGYWEFSFYHMTHLVGMEYLFPIDAYRLELRGSVLVGFSKTSLEYTPLLQGISQSASDMGFAFAVSAGIQFNATQHISPFFDFGIHKSFYSSELSDRNIWGIQMALGVRFYIVNSRSITASY